MKIDEILSEVATTVSIVIGSTANSAVKERLKEYYNTILETFEAHSKNMCNLQGEQLVKYESVVNAWYESLKEQSLEEFKGLNVLQEGLKDLQETIILSKSLIEVNDDFDKNVQQMKLAYSMACEVVMSFVPNLAFSSYIKFIPFGLSRALNKNFNEAKESVNKIRYLLSIGNNPAILANNFNPGNRVIELSQERGLRENLSLTPEFN